MLRRQSRDTNRNIKWLVYCQYGQYSLTFRALALRQRDEGPMLETLDFAIRIGRWQYTDLFIFRFVSLLCLRSTPCLLFFMFPCFPYSYRNTASSQSKLTFSKCYFINVYFHTAYATNNVYCTILIILAVMRPSAKSFVAKLRLESCRHSVNSYISIARFLKKLDNN